MYLVDEIEFLINANKKHEESNNPDDFIISVKKLYARNTISLEAFDMAKKLFPTKAKIAEEAKKNLLSQPEEQSSETSDPCGSGRSYSRSGC